MGYTRGVCKSNYHCFTARIYQNTKAFKPTRPVSSARRQVNSRCSTCRGSALKLREIPRPAVQVTCTDRTFQKLPFPHNNVMDYLPICHICSLYPHFFSFLLSSIVFHITRVIFFQWALCQCLKGVLSFRCMWVGTEGPGRGNSTASGEGKFTILSTHPRLLSAMSTLIDRLLLWISNGIF